MVKEHTHHVGRPTDGRVSFVVTVEYSAGATTKGTALLVFSNSRKKDFSVNKITFSETFAKDENLRKKNLLGKVITFAKISFNFASFGKTLFEKSKSKYSRKFSYKYENENFCFKTICLFV